MVSAIIGSILVVGALTHCTFLYSMYDLKAAQINVQCILIQELMLYKFEMGHNVMETMKKHFFCES